MIIWRLQAFIKQVSFLDIMLYLLNAAPRTEDGASSMLARPCCLYSDPIRSEYTSETVVEFVLEILYDLIDVNVHLYVILAFKINITVLTNHSRFEHFTFRPMHCHAIGQTSK